MTYITKTTIDTGSMPFDSYVDVTEFRSSLPAYSALGPTVMHLRTEGIISSEVCIQQSNKIFEVFTTHTSKEALDAVMTTPEVLAIIDNIEVARAALGWTSTTTEVTESPTA